MIELAIFLARRQHFSRGGSPHCKGLPKTKGPTQLRQNLLSGCNRGDNCLSQVAGLFTFGNFSDVSYVSYVSDVSDVCYVNAMLKSWIRAKRLRHTVPNSVSSPHPNIMLCQPVLKRGELLKNDTPKSGFLEMGEVFSDGSDLRRQLEEECKRILGSDIGTLNAMHLVHNYPYSKSPFINLLRPAVPRFFFADRAPPDKTGANRARKYNDAYTVWRYDYGSGSGTGSVATNESYRIIAPMPVSFTNLHQAIYKKLQGDPRFKSLVRDRKNKFNHATCMGKRKERVQFTHRVNQPKGKSQDGYLSVAILFRCVTKTCPVDVRYNTVAVDERTVNGFDRAPVKKRVAKRKAAQDAAMANKRSRECETVREWNEFLKWKCDKIFG